MSECTDKYHVKNGEILDNVYFEEKIIKSGICIYEVIRVLESIPLFLEKHLLRFHKSAQIINKKIPYENGFINDCINKTIESNKIKYGNIKLIFNFDENIFLSYFIEHSYPNENDYINGVKTIFFHSERNNPNAKIINKSLRERVQENLNKDKAYEAILVDNNGFIREGSKSNIFMVKGKEIYTSPAEDVLIGVTRDVVMDICYKNNIVVREEKVNFKDLQSFDGLFLTGTSPKVLPINLVGEQIFKSQDNLLIRYIMNLYDIKVNNYIINETGGGI